MPGSQRLKRGTVIGLIKAIVYFAMAKRKLKAGEFPAAINLLGKVLAANPSNYYAFNNRGVAKQGIGDHRAAVEDFGEALRLKPNLAVTYYNRGISSKFLGQLDLAVEDQRRALGLVPDYGNALYELGALLFLKQEFALSIEFSTLAINVIRDDRGPVSVRGLAHYALADYESASTDLRRAINLKANPYDILFLHLACVRMGESSDELRANLEKLPKAEWPAPIFNLFLDSMSPEDVKALALGAAQLAEAHFFAGQFHLHHKNMDAAIDALQTAAEDCPNFFLERAIALAELKSLKQQVRKN